MPSGSRFVVILGRSTENLGDPYELVRGAIDHKLEVAVLSIGFPVTPQQQAFVAEALELAMEMGVRLDAEILPGVDRVADRLVAGDEVTVAARGMERRRIEAMVRKRRAEAG